MEDTGYGVSSHIPKADLGKMPPADRRRLLSRLVDEFERRGWREDGHTALALVSMIASPGPEPSAEDIDRVVGKRFQIQNEAHPDEIREALTQALHAEHR
jgi:hypothetical protein